jgi:hypothetical protein
MTYAVKKLLHHCFFPFEAVALASVKGHFIQFEINGNTLTILRGIVIAVIAVFSAVKR